MILLLVRSVWISNGMGYILVFWFYPALIILLTRKPIIRLCHHSFIGEIGKITFDVYVWHVCCYMVMRIVLYMAGYDTSIIMSRKAMHLYGSFCFIVGTISHYMIEQPMNRLIWNKESNIKREERR